MKTTIKILRIDPVRQNIVPMTMKCGKNAAREICRIVRAKRIGSHKLLELESGVPLVVASGLDVDEAMKGWRLKGSEDTAGVGILFGQGPNGGMIDVPVNVKWVQQRIAWLEGEDVEALQERAEALVPALPPEVRAAVLAAVDGGPLAGSEASMLWIPVDHRDVFDAVRVLGLGDEKTKGQRLTRLGETVHNILIAEGKTA